MTTTKLSKLAVSSVILSLSSIVLGLSWIPGIICGHIARARIKSDPGLKGERLALVGLITGYFFSVIVAAIVVYLGGYLERQAVIVDHGRVIWEGHFPHDSSDNIPRDRSDKVLANVTMNGKIIGSIQSRDSNFRLILKQVNSGKEITVWKYRGYSEVWKITSDGTGTSLFLYQRHTLIRENGYITEVSLKDFTEHTNLVSRGRWRL